jgi:hypothetical protein
MSYRSLVSIAAAALLGIACLSTDAFAFRGGGSVRAGGVHAGGARVAGGAYRGGGYRGGAYRGGHGPGWGVGAAAAGAAIGAAAVGAALASPYYYDSYDNSQCGYAPYPPCY